MTKEKIKVQMKKQHHDPHVQKGTHLKMKWNILRRSVMLKEIPQILIDFLTARKAVLVFRPRPSF